jgi:iron-sulfur cluster insertion protein
MIMVSESAKAKIREILAEENDPSLKVRAFVQGGGCSGFQYGFTLDSEQGEDDLTFDFDGVSVLIDSMSVQYMSDATIDYDDDIMGASFKISNPQAQSTCGCGSSFSPF